MSSRPVEEAVARLVSSNDEQSYTRSIPMMPWHRLVQPWHGAARRLLTFPTPLMTPPDTSTYFMAACSARGAVGGRGEKEGSVELTADENFVRSAPASRGHGWLVGPARASRDGLKRGLRLSILCPRQFQPHSIPSPARQLRITGHSQSGKCAEYKLSIGIVRLMPR